MFLSFAGTEFILLSDRQRDVRYFSEFLFYTSAVSAFDYFDDVFPPAVDESAVSGIREK